ncbi:hypothetical protein H8D85_01760 [bacterium]|nr:hypothetical protein [bacterium]
MVQGFNSLNGLATSYTNYYVNYDDTEPSYEIQISYDGGNTFTPSGGSILNGAHTIKLLSDDDILSTSPEPYITGTMSTSGTVVIENSNWIHTTNTSNPYEFTNTITTSNLEGTISFSGTVSNTAGKSSSVNIAD